MTPLDLSKAPPRGPREKLCGAYFLPRTVDKIRSELPGGNPAGYFVDNPIGMSAYMLEKLNIDLAALRAVVAEAANERKSPPGFPRTRISRAWRRPTPRWPP